MKVVIIPILGLLLGLLQSLKTIANGSKGLEVEVGREREGLKRGGEGKGEGGKLLMEMLLLLLHELELALMLLPEDLPFLLLRR